MGRRLWRYAVCRIPTKGDVMDFEQDMTQLLFQEMAQKAALTAAVVAVVMLAARVFGRQAAGLLTGLPIITAPALVWVALEQGSVAATRVAVGSVAACAVAAVFCFCYDRVARKAGPAWCLAVAATGVGFACLAAGIWLEGLLLACVAAALVCAGVLHCLRKVYTVVLPRTELNRSSLTVTIAFAALSGALVTRGQVDPFWVGLLAGLPIVAATVAVTEHSSFGALAVRRFLRGYVFGLIGKLAFGVLFALLLAPAGLTWALLASTACSAAVCALGATGVVVHHRLSEVR